MVVSNGGSSGHESKWAEIPTELLVKIAQLCTKSRLKLSGKLQFRRLRAVCKPWRSALPANHDDVPIPIPIPIPLPIWIPIPTTWPNSFNLVPSTTCVVQSVKDPSDSHLLIVDHLSNGKVFCRKPLLMSYDRSWNWDNSCPKSINLLDYHLSVVSEQLSLRVLIPHHGGGNGFSFLDSFCMKAVLISNPNPKEIDDGVALVLFDGMLGMYVFNEKKWEMIYEWDNYKPEKCSDIIQYEEDGDGCVIVIDHLANAFRVNYDFHLRKLEWTKIAYEIRPSRVRRKRLVVDSEHGGLFLIVQTPSKYNVHWFYKQRHKWEKLRLDPGFSIFVGNDFAFTTNSKTFPGVCYGNCIYASKGSFPLYNKRDFDNDMEILFEGIEDGPYVFRFGEDCSGVISDLSGHGCDYRSIFESPKKWLELNRPPPSDPQPPL